MLNPVNFVLQENCHYMSEHARLASYRHANWPSTVPLTPQELAKAGWFYVGQQDRVQCPWCSGSFFRWMPGHSAFGEHRRHFPECTFVVGYMQRSQEPVERCMDAQGSARDQKIGMALQNAYDMELPAHLITKASESLQKTHGKNYTIFFVGFKGKIQSYVLVHVA